MPPSNHRLQVAPTAPAACYCFTLLKSTATWLRQVPSHCSQRVNQQQQQVGAACVREPVAVGVCTACKQPNT
jgi:hypothetical protein